MTTSSSTPPSLPPSHHSKNKKLLVTQKQSKKTHIIVSYKKHTTWWDYRLPDVTWVVGTWPASSAGWLAAVTDLVLCWYGSYAGSNLSLSRIRVSSLAAGLGLGFSLPALPLSPLAPFPVAPLPPLSHPQPQPGVDLFSASISKHKSS